MEKIVEQKEDETVARNWTSATKERIKEFENILENILKKINETDKKTKIKQKELTEQIEEEQAQKRYEEAKKYVETKINFINAKSAKGNKKEQTANKTLNGTSNIESKAFKIENNIIQWNPSWLASVLEPILRRNR